MSSGDRPRQWSPDSYLHSQHTHSLTSAFSETNLGIFQDALETLLSHPFLSSSCLFCSSPDYPRLRSSTSPSLKQVMCVSTRCTCAKMYQDSGNSAPRVFPRVSTATSISRPLYTRQGEVRMVRHSGTH